MGKQNIKEKTHAHLCPPVHFREFAKKKNLCEYFIYHNEVIHSHNCYKRCY